MKMLRHDHVTHHHESIALARLLQDGKKHVTAAGRAQQRRTLITTAGNEVQVARAVVSVQSLGHD
jgi:hypothetical protein